MKEPNFKSTCKIKVRRGLNMEMWDMDMKSLRGEDGGSNGSLGEE
jgi:hypothetical protein